MERRKTPRTYVRKLAYVNFEPYNTGGVITELSASGLRFHTITPLQQGGVLRLSLVFAGMNHLDAVGEVVWTDSTRKVGGVRFVVLAPAAADQIRKWLENSASANGSQTDAKAETVPVTEPGASIPSASSVQLEKTLAPAAASPAIPQLSDAHTGGTPAPSTWVVRAKPSAISITHFDPDPPRRRSPFVRGLVGAVIVCLIVPPMVQFGLRHYNWLSSWIPYANPVVVNPVAATPTPTPTSGILPGLDVSNSGETNSRAANPAEATSLNTANPAPSTEQAEPAAPNPNSQPANPRTAAVTESSEPSAAEIRLAPQPEAAAPETAQSPSEGNPLATAPRNSVVPTSQRVAQIPASSAPQPADNPGESELILAWQYLEDQGGRPRDPVAASRLLWTAIKKGNLTAETTLANLYLRGEGVSKSCDQARVLLSAASDKGSIEAKRKLRELNEMGCR
jgi:PilZ domain